MTYRGRFAPSPTGPLHFGSLVAAVGSYLQAKSAHREVAGQWLIRIEDIDTPRCIPGAADSILRSLESFGFEWDESIIYQSARNEVYQQALQTLRDLNLCYPCSCSRSELQAATGTMNDGDELRYPGWCRQQPRRITNSYAWRFRVPEQPIEFNDAIHGSHRVDLTNDTGDFVIKRRDGLFAYQLAVVVDDAAQNITEVVRGHDLLFNTPRQIALQHALQLPTPNYVHLPLVRNNDGKKLSKSTAASALSNQSLSLQLWQALNFLQQSPPVELQILPLDEIWAWAKVHWQLQPLIISETLGLKP